MNTDKLEARGWAFAGHGLYAEVYVKGAYAIKISDGGDDWEDYVIWATKAGYAGTFAPRVYCVHRYAHKLIALMERLDTTVSEYRETDRELCRLVEGLWRESVPQELETRYPGVSAFMAAARGAGFANDLHGGNLMLQHSTNRLVLTDPSSRPSHTNARRWRAVGNMIVTRDGQSL